MAECEDTGVYKGGAATFLGNRICEKQSLRFASGIVSHSKIMGRSKTVNQRLTGLAFVKKDVSFSHEKENFVMQESLLAIFPIVQAALLRAVGHLR
jgi:hypothetical protein